jgi:Asp-tRNA(Asn)/Glu-tRNA(Gln) amidotransferase A subunit family amidase
MSTYSPRDFRPLTFHDAVHAFLAGSDTPRAYLERCLQTIAEREPVVRAWVVMNEAGAREAADAATDRYRAGRPLSPIDGMPIGIKDLYETEDMPTQMGCEAFAGNWPKLDAPLVKALRQAGAVVLGKTVTTEMGMSHPGPTTNPFDPDRTPGGSSSGSAAAVGARMVPAAIGSQVMGSVIRPAAYCANHAIKVTFGALNRGTRQMMSHAAIGIHAGCHEDMWTVAAAIAARAGGDPGRPGLYGTEMPPEPRRPTRLIVMQTEGWSAMTPKAIAAFEAVLEQLRNVRIEVLRRGDHPAIEAFERAVNTARDLSNDIVGWETRFQLEHLAQTAGNRISRRLAARMHAGCALTLEDYRWRLIERDAARAAHAALAPMADAIVAPACTGPAPVWRGDEPGLPLEPWPTGDVSCNTGTSILGCPAVTVPVAAVEGMPFGIQFVGQPHADAQTSAIAAWAASTLTPVVIP